jgi:hypothetical protein
MIIQNASGKIAKSPKEKVLLTALFLRRHHNAARRCTMQMDDGTGRRGGDDGDECREIAQLEKEFEEARDQLLREDGQRYRIIMREIAETEKERIFDRLTDRHERILFGLEPPGASRAGERPAKSGGDLECSLCGKGGLTELGLKLHMARKHKGEKKKAAAPAA